jgi:hypothetical protein
MVLDKKLAGADLGRGAARDRAFGGDTGVRWRSLHLCIFLLTAIRHWLPMDWTMCRHIGPGYWHPRDLGGAGAQHCVRCHAGHLPEHRTCCVHAVQQEHPDCRIGVRGHVCKSMHEPWQQMSAKVCSEQQAVIHPRDPRSLPLQGSMSFGKITACYPGARPWSPTVHSLQTRQTMHAVAVCRQLHEP